MPPSASTNFPVCLRSAPVNEPRSWPKSSDSMSESGIAAQFTCTNGPAFTSEPSWIARATSSLPVPLGPTMRTVAGVGAAFAMSASSRRIALAVPDDAREAEARLQLLVLAHEARRVEDAPERVQDVLGRERLLEEVVGPGVHGLHRRLHVAVARDDDHGRRDPARAELRERLEAVLAGHLDVEEHGVVVRRLGDRARPRGDRRHVVSLL